MIYIYLSIGIVYKRLEGAGDTAGASSDVENRLAHVKIFRQGRYYGFADPFYVHESLDDLVIHHREDSLQEFNKDLDRLLYPASMPPPPNNWL